MGCCKSPAAAHGVQILLNGACRLASSVPCVSGICSCPSFCCVHKAVTVFGVVSAALHQQCSGHNSRMQVPPYNMCHITVHTALDGAVDAPRQLCWLQLHTHHDVWFLLLPMHLHQTHPQALCQRWDRSCRSFPHCVASHSGPRLPCDTHGWLPLMPLLQLQ